MVEGGMGSKVPQEIEVRDFQVVSRQFTDRFFDQFTDRALGIRAEEDKLLLFLALDIDSSPHS